MTDCSGGRLESDLRRVEHPLSWLVGVSRPHQLRVLERLAVLNRRGSREGLDWLLWLWDMSQPDLLRFQYYLLRCPVDDWQRLALWHLLHFDA